jgi:hypothetical protein
MTIGKATWYLTYCGVGMKRELLHYLAGLCQAASAALMASAVIMPDMRTESLFGCAASAAMGMTFVYFKEV